MNETSSMPIFSCCREGRRPYSAIQTSCKIFIRARLFCHGSCIHTQTMHTQTTTHRCVHTSCWGLFSHWGPRLWWMIADNTEGEKKEKKRGMHQRAPFKRILGPAALLCTAVGQRVSYIFKKWDSVWGFLFFDRILPSSTSSLFPFLLYRLPLFSPHSSFSLRFFTSSHDLSPHVSSLTTSLITLPLSFLSLLPSASFHIISLLIWTIIFYHLLPSFSLPSCPFFFFFSSSPVHLVFAPDLPKLSLSLLISLPVASSLFLLHCSGPYPNILCIPTSLTICLMGKQLIAASVRVLSRIPTAQKTGQSEPQQLPKGNTLSARHRWFSSPDTHAGTNWKKAFKKTHLHTEKKQVECTRGGLPGVQVKCRWRCKK